jgi:hypothetical protein
MASFVVHVVTHAAIHQVAVDGREFLSDSLFVSEIVTVQERYLGPNFSRAYLNWMCANE